MFPTQQSDSSKLTKLILLLILLYFKIDLVLNFDFVFSIEGTLEKFFIAYLVITSTICFLDKTLN